MIQVQLKLRMTKAQTAECERWLYHLQSVWNWAIRKIELNAENKIYFRRFEFMNLLAGHSKKLGIPSHVLQGVLSTAYMSWKHCFSGLADRPRLKGKRNRMNSIPFPDPIRRHARTRIAVRGLGSLRFHPQDIPAGTINSSRLCRRASGWYLCLFIHAEPRPIARVGDDSVGIDPGFGNLLTTSTGEIIGHPREFEAAEKRLSQAQRAHNRGLSSRLQESIRNRRKDRNHKLSRHLVEKNSLIVFSADRHHNIAARFGKSVASSAHYQLRRMLKYKAASSGCRYIEVDSKNSTKTCSNCGALSGPSGWGGLAVRQWRCACGAQHDRDVNAAINTLIAGAGLAHERVKPSETLAPQGDHHSNG